MSANQLAQFMVASDTGRLGIIRKARQIGSAGAIRYSDLRRAVRAHLTHPYRSNEALDAAASMFQQKSNDNSHSDYGRDDALKSIEALESFRRMSNKLNAIDFAPTADGAKTIMIAGVEVSVNLDALVNGTGGRIGGTLLRFSQSDGETDEATRKRQEVGRYAATLVFVFVGQVYGDKNTADRSLCSSIDVQFNDVIYAPTNTSVRVKNIESACRFISAAWSGA